MTPRETSRSRVQDMDPGAFVAAVLELVASAHGIPLLATSAYVVAKTLSELAQHHLANAQLGSLLSLSQRDDIQRESLKIADIVAQQDEDSPSAMPSPPPPPSLSGATDSRFCGLPGDLWFSDAVLWLEGSGVFDETVFPKSYFDHRIYNTAKSVTREELAVMMVRGVLGVDPPSSSRCTYSDIPPTSSYARHIGVLQASNFAEFAPVSHRFGFGDPISRSELARIALAASGFPSIFSPSAQQVDEYVDVRKDQRYSHIYVARVLKLMTGDGGKNRFRPNHPTNRVEAAMVVARLRVRLLEEARQLSICRNAP